MSTLVDLPIERYTMDASSLLAMQPDADFNRHVMLWSTIFGLFVTGMGMLMLRVMGLQARWAPNPHREGKILLQAIKDLLVSMFVLGCPTTILAANVATAFSADGLRDTYNLAANCLFALTMHMSIVLLMCLIIEQLPRYNRAPSAP